MKLSFLLADFPNAAFEIQTSVWTGKTRLFMNQQQLTVSKEKGNPFLIPIENKEFVKAYPIRSFPDAIPALKINNVQHDILEKLKWYEIAVCASPMCLILIGGAIGGIMGALATNLNLAIFRNENNITLKYVKAIGIAVAAALVYTLIATLIILAVQP